MCGQTMAHGAQQQQPMADRLREAARTAIELQKSWTDEAVTSSEVFWVALPYTEDDEDVHEAPEDDATFLLLVAEALND